MIIVLQILNLVIVFVITYFHAEKFWKNEVITTSFHIFWAAVHGLFMLMFQTFFGWEHWVLIVLLILGRILFYGPLLNLQRTPKRSWFYLSVAGEHPAITDKVLISLGNWYRVLWYVGAAILIYINIRTV